MRWSARRIYNAMYEGTVRCIEIYKTEFEKKAVDIFLAE